VAIVFVLALAIGAWLNWSWISSQWHVLFPPAQARESVVQETGPKVELVADKQDTLLVPRELLATPRFRTGPVVGTPAPEPLRLRGSIILDPNRNSRVHSLFTGQVVKVGLPGNMSQDSKGLADNPEKGLRPNDEVKKGQVLAVIYSKDAGALKTDLLNQLTKLWADQTILDRYEKTEKEAPGVVPPTTLTQQRQAVQQDWVLVRNAQRNLRASRFTEEEIKIVEDEANKLKTNPNAPHDPELERTWAEYLVRAPFDSRIVEKNATLGDAIDPTTDLYKLAKLDRLQVLVDVYEEDLPKLKQIADEADAAEKEAMKQALPQGGIDSPGLKEYAQSVAQEAGDKIRTWTINYQATGEGETGAFDKLNTHIDPMQHTGSLLGWVNNSQKKLFIGQFVIATVKLKPDRNLVAVPTSAVIESGDGPMVFVRVNPSELAWFKITDSTVELLRKSGMPDSVVGKLDPAKNQQFKSQQAFEEELGKRLGEDERKHWQSAILKHAAEPLFTQRKVAVVVRGREQIFLRCVPTPAEAERGASPISADETVVVRGAVELAGELDALKTEGKKDVDDKKEPEGKQ
jgi:multidrug efflux pump subunit AcrA (membrane-fusion protein)